MTIRRGVFLPIICAFLLGECYTTDFVTMKDERGNYPIHEAARVGKLERVKYLVSKGANVNARNNAGETPLHCAAYNGHIEIAGYLLSEGADIDARDKNGSSPFHDVIKISKVKMARYLATQGANIDTKDDYGKTPIHDATTLGNMEIVRYLVSQGVDVNAKDKRGYSPIHDAATMGHLDILKHLVSQGVEINAKDNNGNSPLHIAARTGDFEIVKYLVSQGADVNVKNKNGEAALDEAVFGRHTKVAIYLYSQMELFKQKQDLKQLASKTDPGDLRPEATGIDFGRYLALVIGNNSYMFLPKLVTAKNDALEVARILKYGYDFDVKLLLDAKRSDILLALGKLRGDLTERDNLLIYYAGHGWLDKEGDEGYWLPIDAEEDNTINWISNSSITTTLKAMKAKHVLILADSCYSGKLVRGIRVGPRPDGYLSGLVQKKARSVLSSGGLEPVADSGGKGKHSVFASAFLDALRENRAIMDGTQLFSNLRRKVMLNSDQTPEYSDIRKAGHEGGEFIFVRNR